VTEPSHSAGLRTLAALAWPVVLSRSAQAVIGFSDALMTAPLGEHALAATTAGAMNVLCAAILPMGVAFIVQSFAAQLSGRGDLSSARRYGWYGLCLAGVAALLAVAGLPLVRWAVGGLDYAPDVRASMSDYIEIRLLAMFAIVGVEALGNWYGGLGDTRRHMIASFLMMGANVALNWLLIEGNLGAPALGVAGAAWASVASTWLGFLLLLGWFLAGRGLPRPLAGGRLRLAEFLRMLRFGGPNGLNWFLEFAAFMFFVNVVVADLGTVAVAALLAVIQVNSVAFMPAFGLSSAGAILAGQAIGAGRPGDVPKILRLTMTTAAVWQGLVGLLYCLFPGLVMALFVPRDASRTEIVEIGATMLALSAAWQLFDAVAMAVGETLRAAGDTAFSLWARLVIAWLVFVPGAWLAIGPLGGGPNAAILAIVGYLALLGGVLFVRFRSGAWRRIDLTGSEPAVV
jgi:MATE family multidrug resistance protein